MSPSVDQLQDASNWLSAASQHGLGNVPPPKWNVEQVVFSLLGFYDGPIQPDAANPNRVNAAKLAAARGHWLNHLHSNVHIDMPSQEYVDAMLADVSAVQRAVTNSGLVQFHGYGANGLEVPVTASADQISQAVQLAITWITTYGQNGKGTWEPFPAGPIQRGDDYGGAVGIRLQREEDGARALVWFAIGAGGDWGRPKNWLGPIYPTDAAYNQEAFQGGPPPSSTQVLVSKATAAAASVATSGKAPPVHGATAQTSTSTPNPQGNPYDPNSQAYKDGTDGSGGSGAGATGNGAPPAAKPALSTGQKVGIGAGLLGLVGFFVLRK